MSKMAGTREHRSDIVFVFVPLAFLHVSKLYSRPAPSDGGKSYRSMLDLGKSSSPAYGRPSNLQLSMTSRLLNGKQNAAFI
jgi:hypothetical protein